ncbi:hypothetical protein GE09DRAFT_1209614 [Coniochaeta sp. 2T2.1]|nr:hypothetical protein GE09DRAFT_1209614 [Coniochaeta sp. 2T2.1]
MSSDANIVVLGAGVLGLTTALQLARQGYKNIAVIAKHVPGDSHPDYTSSWAGANYVPYEDLRQESLNLWWKGVVDDSQCLSLGVTFRRVTVGHIREAFDQNVPEGSTPDVVVNCTGLWASKLGGVMDDKVVPMRGQLVIVENESHGMFSLSGDGSMKEEFGECCYIIDRQAAGGTALGGSYYLSWDREPDMALAERVMKRTIQICPHLVPEGAGIEALRVIRHQVGLRPVRAGGPRIELETLDEAGEGKLRVVHCYGAGGFGFQSSYGMANKAVALVGDTLDRLN